MEGIKQFFIDFFSANLLTKILLFLSAFFAPVWKLYILLIFLASIDYIIDISVWFFKKEYQNIKCWSITFPYILKLIMYSILVITVNAVQIYLIEDLFDFFKLVLAIPIFAELLSIVGTVEKYTGVALVDKIKEYISTWVNSKKPLD